MNQKEKIVALAEILSSQFKKDFIAMAMKEILDHEFLNMSDFESCRDRAKAGIDISVSGVIDSLGYAIALSREGQHGENTTVEQAALLSAEADPLVGAYSWWNQ